MKHNWEKLKRGYKGAGILFYHIDSDGKVEVILGLRRIRPDLGKWSIPGGRRSPKDSSPLENAIREAEEEGFLIPQAERDVLVQQPRRFVFPIIHFFEWSTYFVQLDNKPPLTKWPVNTPDFVHEFSEAGWFETNKLPQNTHFGVKLALWYCLVYR